MQPVWKEKVIEGDLEALSLIYKEQKENQGGSLSHYNTTHAMKGGKS